MSAVRGVVRWGWISLLSVWCGSVGWSQCLSVADVQTRIARAKQTPAGVTAQLFAEVRQQLIRNQCPADSLLARVTMQLGYAQYLQQQPDSAVRSLRKSIRLFLAQPTGQRAGLVSAYMYLGQVLQSQNSVQLATEAYRSCLALGRDDARYDAPVGYALSDLALLAYQNGDYEAGLAYAEQGTDRARRGQNVRLEARSLSEAARCLLNLNRYGTALHYCDQAIALLQNDSTADNDRRLYGLFRAQALVGLGQYDRALTLYRHIQTGYQQMNQRSRVADVCGYIGELFATRLNDPVQATRYLRQAHSLYENPYEKSRMLQSIGNLQKQAGQYRAALTTFQQALQTLPIQFHKPDLRTNPDPETIRLSAYKEYLLTLIWYKADTWLAYAQTTSQPTSALTQALSTYHVADQMIDQMRWAQHGEQSKLYWRQQTRAFYEQALETCYRLNNPEQALYFFEKSRAVLLADKLNELGASRELPPGLQAEEQSLRRTVDNRLADLSRLTPGSAEHIRTRALLLTDQERVDGFVRQLEQTNPTYFRYKYDNWVPRLADLQPYLRQRKATFVSYFVGDSALYMLDVRADQARLIRQPLATYRTDAARYLTLLSQPEQLNQSFSTFLALSNRLHTWLLAPLTQASGRIIVSPDGSFIPFETLSQSPTQAAYAIDNAAFSYAYSARLLLRQVSPATNTVPDGDFLGLAPGRFAPSLKQAPLPGSQTALEQIGAGFRSSMLLQNAEATRRAFQESAPLYRVIHLFTHATANGEPRLYFADSTLALSELDRNMMKHAQLVTLAACETGTGVDQAGEGVFSLARGFAALGVPSVLTTLWSVQNKATYQISAQFYHNLADGLPKDIALQQARRDWIKNADGADLLPSVWAGLILVGDTEPLQTGDTNGWLGGLPGLLVGGLVQLGWRRWRRERAINIRLLSE